MFGLLGEPRASVTQANHPLSYSFSLKWQRSQNVVCTEKNFSVAAGCFSAQPKGTILNLEFKTSNEISSLETFLHIMQTQNNHPISGNYLLELQLVYCVTILNVSN